MNVPVLSYVPTASDNFVDVTVPPELRVQGSTRNRSRPDQPTTSYSHVVLPRCATAGAKATSSLAPCFVDTVAAKIVHSHAGLFGWNLPNNGADESTTAHASSPQRSRKSCILSSSRGGLAKDYKFDNFDLCPSAHFSSSILTFAATILVP